MPDDFDIVVSAENTNYQAWQCMVFHVSCRTATGRTPIFVVHGDESEPLVEGFEAIAADDGIVQRRPNYRHAGRLMYAPRNQMRTVGLVETDAEHLVLCDPDMVFLRPVDFGELIAEMDDDQLSLDQISFLVVTDENRPFIEQVCVANGLDIDAVAARPMNGATPHVIRRQGRIRLVRTWDHYLEAYLAASHEHHGDYHPDVWISSMWGLALAMHHLGLRPHFTERCIHTLGDPPIPADTDAWIVHYSYDTPDFDKRAFSSDETWDQVWQVTPATGTATGVVRQAIVDAAVHFGRR